MSLRGRPILTLVIARLPYLNPRHCEAVATAVAIHPSLPQKRHCGPPYFNPRHCEAVATAAAIHPSLPQKRHCGPPYFNPRHCEAAAAAAAICPSCLPKTSLRGRPILTLVIARLSQRPRQSVRPASQKRHCEAAAAAAAICPSCRRGGFSNPPESGLMILFAEVYIK